MYNRPALADLVTRIRADLLSRLSTDDVLRRSDPEVLARVLAGVAHGLYGYIEWIFGQLIYDTAESDILDRWASIWLPVPRKAAASATGSVSFTVTAGAVVPAGTVLQALDGVQYQTTADATGTAPTYTAPVAAVVPAAAGNRAAGQTLTLVAPIAGVQSGAVAGALSGGADVETDDALRARLVARIQNPPQGGSVADYVGWATSVAGVTRAWVSADEQGPGTVVVRFVRDNDGTGAAIIPDAGEVATVQAYIDPLRPVTAVVTVAAPTPLTVNYALSVTPDTPAVRAAVQAELADLHVREAIPGGTLYLSHIHAAISAAAGEVNHVLTAPAADVVPSIGAIPVLGTVTFS